MWVNSSFIARCLILGLLIPSIGQAAQSGLPYVAVYGGVSLPQSFQDARGIGDLSSVKLTDLALKRSPIYGVKIGLVPTGSWSMIETEFFYTNPHLKQQDVTATGPSGSGTQNFAGAHVRVATLAFNWIFIYRGARFQPYAGVGLGIFWARISGEDFGTSADTSPGLNALGGARFFLTQQVALFGEYKYNRATFDFGRDVALHSLYQAHDFVGGLSLHF